MNRRSFLGLFGAGVAGIAISKAIPFGRVWSFPKEIVIASPEDLPKQFLVGSTIQVRFPQRFLIGDYCYADLRANGWSFPTPELRPAFPQLPS